MIALLPRARVAETPCLAPCPQPSLIVIVPYHNGLRPCHCFANGLHFKPARWERARVRGKNRVQPIFNFPTTDTLFFLISAEDRPAH